MPILKTLRASFLLLILLISGCNVVSSYRVAGEDARAPRNNASGSYFLPKHLLVVTATSEEMTVETKAVQDRTTLLQVGLNLSGFSHDTITVAYADGLLSKVTSIADDKTADIIKELAKAAGRFRSVSGDAKQPPLVLEFDPFDPEEALAANRIIGKRFKGSCVEVELLPGMWSAGCGRHSLAWDNNTLPDPQDIRVKLRAEEPGIYYKRSLDHRVHVVFNNRTTNVSTYKFANIAPVFRVDVNRTVFVKRKTVIEFEDGELTSVMVDKPSEVLAVAQLPVSIANAYISGVVDAFTQRKSVQKARADLLTQQAATLRAEQKLIEAQIAAASSLQTSQERSAALLSLQRSTTIQTDETFEVGGRQDRTRTLQNIRDCQRILEQSQEECIETFRSLDRSNQD
ncbi:MAG: hypothetical protein NXI27_06185 [Alphaproteobacteria bacterium]|nr:hypothetical protein [Alphaproteobacteria bacterium]